MELGLGQFFTNVFFVVVGFWFDFNTECDGIWIRRKAFNYSQISYIIKKSNLKTYVILVEPPCDNN